MSAGLGEGDTEALCHWLWEQHSGATTLRSLVTEVEQIVAAHVDALQRQVADLQSRLACVAEATYWDRPYDERLAAVRGMCDLRTDGMTPQPERPWRVGRHYGIHVYAGDRPVATFHDEADAALAVAAVGGYPVEDHAPRVYLGDSKVITVEEVGPEGLLVLPGDRPVEPDLVAGQYQ